MCALVARKRRSSRSSSARTATSRARSREAPDPRCKVRLLQRRPSAQARADVLRRVGTERGSLTTPPWSTPSYVLYVTGLPRLRYASTSGSVNSLEHDRCPRPLLDPHRRADAQALGIVEPAERGGRRRRCRRPARSSPAGASAPNERGELRCIRSASADTAAPRRRSARRCTPRPGSAMSSPRRIIAARPLSALGWVRLAAPPPARRGARRARRRPCRGACRSGVYCAPATPPTARPGRPASGPEITTRFPIRLSSLRAARAASSTE